jgi:sulfate transport system permease protein
MVAATPTAPAVGSRRRREAKLGRLGRGSAITLGISLIGLSLVVLIPLAAVAVKAGGNGWSGFWTTLSSPEVAAALRLTIGEALIVTVVNVVMGTLIAWVLVRDDFPGKAIFELVIDVPFALPTIVAGLVLLSMYGPQSPVGLRLANTRVGIFVALLFVTVPFVVRSVEPVLIELDRDAEEAAASLGAGRLTVFRRIVLPNLLPAIAAGAALSFARAVSEYGSLVLLSGNLPFKTQVASVKILALIESDNPASAAAVAAVLLLVAVVTLIAIDLLRRWAARRA